MSKFKKFITNHFNIVVFLFLAIVVFSLYGKTLFFDWSYLDDDTLIVDRQDYLKFSNIKNVFFDTVFGKGDIGYRPVLNISFLIDNFLYGINPHGYHLTNILIFLFSVFFVFLIFSYKHKKNFILFAFVSIIAVHPMLSNIVAWIPGRNDSLLTLFAISSFYFFLLYIKTKKIFYFSIHLFLLLISLFTKETAIVLPIIYFLFYLSLDKINRNKIFLFLISLIICYVIFFYCRYCAINKYENNDIGFLYVMRNIYFNFYVVFIYFYNILFPITIHLNNIIHFLLTLLSLLIFLLILKNKYNFINKKIFFICLFSFVLLIIPTIIRDSNLYSSNRIFLPMIFIIYILFELIQKIDINKKIIYIVLLSCFCIFFIISSNNLNKFENKWTYYTYLLQENPQNSFVYAKFASMLADIKMYDEAIVKYNKAIEIEPYNYNHYNNLAVVYIKKHDFINAKNNLIIAKNLKDDDENINYNLELVEKYLKNDK